MTTHLTFETLCDLSDGVLAGADDANARDHLQSCGECSARLASLSALALGAASLPQSIDPPADLWNDIRGRISAAPAGPVVSRWRVPQFIAAAMLVAVASSALTMVFMRGRSGPVRSSEDVARETPARHAVVLPASLASTERGFERSVSDLQRQLAERRDSLAPSTVATVERSLRIADSAIAEARGALVCDPGNAALVKLFASNYERKIDVLKRATELAPRT